MLPKFSKYSSNKLAGKNQEIIAHYSSQQVSSHTRFEVREAEVWVEEERVAGVGETNPQHRQKVLVMQAGEQQPLTHRQSGLTRRGFTCKKTMMDNI